MRLTSQQLRALQVKMKPCPFCGAGTARLQPQGLGSEAVSLGQTVDAVHAGCDRCGAWGPIALSVPGAVRLWNMRRPKPGTGIQPADLNRRAEVEQRLLDAYTGKRPLPTREECRDLAYRLGVPEEHRKDSAGR